MPRRLRLLLAVLGVVFFSRVLLTASTPDTERAARRGSSARGSPDGLSARLPVTPAGVTLVALARNTSASVSAPPRLPAAAAVVVKGGTGAAPSMLFAAFDEMTAPDARRLVDAWRSPDFSAPAGRTPSQVIDTAVAVEESVAGSGVFDESLFHAAALPAPTAPTTAPMTVGGDAGAVAASYETLPLTGPIPMPGDEALTAATAAGWTGPPRVLAASPPPPGLDASRVGDVLKRDEHGAYREAFATVTAYCPCERCCGELARGITSLGKSAWSRGVAADPRCLEYGARVYIPGYGVSAVDDTGGAMRRSWRRRGRMHLDVRFTYHWEARQWGRRFLVVRVYEE